MRLRILILAVDDLARARVFYERVLGAEAVVEAPSYVELSTPSSLRLGLYRRDGFAANTRARLAEPPPPGATTSTEIYAETEDFAATRAAILAHGGAELSPLALRGWGEDVAYFRDPDGNVLAIAALRQ